MPRNRAFHHPSQDRARDPAIDHALIDQMMRPTELCQKWSVMPSGWQKVFFFHRAPDVIVTSGSRHWTCPRTGGYGEGSISLVAHVYKISFDEAALRLARFLCVSRRLHMEQFEAKSEIAA